MIDIGRFALRLSLGAVLLGIIFSVAGVVTRRRRFSDASRRLCYLNFAFVLLSTAGLVYAFLTDQFQIQYVWGHSERAMPDVYKFSALWGGMEGSLLLWLFILTLFSAVYVFAHRNENRYSYTSGTVLGLLVVQLFFLALLNFPSFPFASVPGGRIPNEGSGLNPLLQNPGMAVHPPLLYLGFVGLTIPFAQATGALLSGHLDDHWLENARTWSLVAWMILGVGIMRGGLWAYQELGWGGYWAWDPVENASLMPWLLVTAFIHSIMIQKHRGMLKVWNIILAFLAFAFTILGTFLTRSGALASVHTFAQNKTLSITFLSFLGLIVVACIGLLSWRWNRMESSSSLESFLSREFMFVLNNLILVGITFVICWGTLFPFLSEWVTGTRQTVGPPYFNMVTIPLFLLLIFTTGVGSLIGWGQASWTNLRRNFTLPLIGFLVSIAPFWWIVTNYATALHDIQGSFKQNLSYLYTTLAFSLTVFTALTMLQEYVRATASRVRRFGENILVAFFRAFSKNHRRYGGYLAHLGLLVVVVGVATSSAFRTETVRTARPGEQFQVTGYTVKFENIERFRIPKPPRDHWNAVVWQANLKFRRPDGSEGYLLPQVRRYRNVEQRFNEVARDVQPSGDFYVVISGLPGENSRAVFTIYHNPLISLVWLGVLWMAFGGFLALVPIHRLLSHGSGNS